MALKFVVTAAVAVLLMAGGARIVLAQDEKPEEPKGVTTRGLVGSTGAIPRLAMTIPVVLTGQVVELAAGGQSGRMRVLAPAYIYILDGILTINTYGGPIGVSGVQYHGTGQSYAPPTGLWFNTMNTGQGKVKYLMLYLGTPGGAVSEQAKADE
jgi:hypothetical protein